MGPEGQVPQRLGQAGAVDGHALEDLERDGAVVQAYNDDRHACRRSLACEIWPDLMSSSMSESSAFCQSSAPGTRPDSFIIARVSDNRLSRTSYSGPISNSRRRRSHDANAGLAPLVEMAMVSSPRRTMAGRNTEQCPGSSALLTQTPAPSASS